MQNKNDQYRKIVNEYKKAQKSPYIDVKKAFDKILAELGIKTNSK